MLLFTFIMIDDVNTVIGRIWCKLNKASKRATCHYSVADQGFPIGGGADLVGGCQLTMVARFFLFCFDTNVYVENERI